MMSKAQEQLGAKVSWLIHDLNTYEKLNVDESSMDAVLSTLVLEHIVSLDRYFQTIFRILKKNDGSWAWISAMHPNMFRAGSQAGFLSDSTTGEKVYGVSFDHSIDAIVRAAERNGLKLIRCVEKGVESDEHAQQLGPRATKWTGIAIHVSFLFQVDREPRISLRSGE